MALLELRDVEARYGQVRALDGVSLAVEQGQIVAVLGANGAGKTTTLRSISGTVKRSGQILFDGKPLGRRGPESVAKLGVAHVPEGRGTFAELSVEENLQLGAYVRRGGSIDDDIARVSDVLPVDRDASRPARRHALRRRAADARARPRADEPSADAPARRALARARAADHP